MKAKRNKSWRCLAGHGLTLVEVLASLVILGSILGALLVAHGRSTRQWAAADQRLEAVRIADRLLSKWWAAGGIPPQNQNKVNDRFAWRTLTLDRPLPVEWAARVIRLEVFTVDDEHVHAAVEVLAPNVTGEDTATGF